MKPILLFLILTTFSQTWAAEDPLHIAKQLSQVRFKGWTYGSKASQKQIDCVQFVLAVVEETAGPLSSESKAQILIANIPPNEAADLPQLIISEDPRTKGVQQAIVDLKQGKVVTPAEAKPGDFVQYWMKRKDGTWYGHCALIEKVEKQGQQYKATLYGAHQSSNGIGSSNYQLILNGSNRKVYLVRLSP